MVSLGSIHGGCIVSMVCMVPVVSIYGMVLVVSVVPLVSLVSILKRKVSKLASSFRCRSV